MDTHQKSLRFGITMILCAFVFRMYTAGVFTEFVQFLQKPDTAAFLIYLETGRDVRSSFSHEAIFVYPSESPPPQLPKPAEEPPPPEDFPAFTPEDAETIALYNLSGRKAELGELLCRELSWQKSPGAPEVLILHTHATESYTPAGERYKESSAYRTLDENYNMLSIGEKVAAILEEGGIGVIQDRELHDYPSYNGSYNHARKSVEQYLKEYPSIRLVLDLHRDAADSGTGQLRTRATAGDQPCAQLMLVMGTDASGLDHPNWEDNLSLALKLHVLLERNCPGITRHLVLRKQRFNQDLCPGMLLVEVGAAGNTRAEALTAAQVLGSALLSLLE